MTRESIMSTEMTQRSIGRENENTKVTVQTLSEISGVPLDYIKKELLIDEGTEVSLDELRQVMLKHLDTTFGK